MKFKNVCFVKNLEGLTKVCCNSVNEGNYNECFFLNKKQEVVAHFKTNGRFSVLPMPLSKKNNLIFKYVELFDKKENTKEKIVRVNKDLSYDVLHEYDEILNSNKEDTFLVIENSLCGIIDYNGTEIIKPQYDYCGCFSNGLAYVRQNEKYGYINKQNEFIVPCKYDSIGFADFDGYLILGFCEDPKSYDVMNKNGEIIYHSDKKVFNYGKGYILEENQDGEFEIKKLI